MVLQFHRHFHSISILSQFYHVLSTSIQLWLTVIAKHPLWNFPRLETVEDGAAAGFEALTAGEDQLHWDFIQTDFLKNLPSGKLTFCYGQSQFFMGKSTISMAIFNSYVSLPEGMFYVLGINNVRITFFHDVYIIFPGSDEYGLGICSYSLWVPNKQIQVTKYRIKI